MSFVFEADILTPHWYRERRHYELDDELMRQVLDELQPEQNSMNISVDELRELLMNTGEVTAAVKLGGKKEEIEALLKSIAAGAWKKHVPWELEEVELEYHGDGKFDRFVAAYVPSFRFREVTNEA